MSLSVGIRLGPYEVLDFLGAGGMGEVYRALDPRLGREVAIKVLPAEVGAEVGRLQRFEREARAVAALNHPNILTIFDVGMQPAGEAVPQGLAGKPTPYVVTELLQGETLREMASRRAPSQRQFLSFVAQAAQGLEAAHAKGILHRDIKPENVFVTTDGRAKLLDFGLAKLVDWQGADSADSTEVSPTGAGQLVGTVSYMSPEQVRGQPLDPRTDIFSLGVVLYELLGGRHPFRRDTTTGTLTAILEDAPPDLATLSRGVPPALSGIVRRCLQKDRAERYGSAHDVGVALEAVLQAPVGAASLQEVEEKSPYPGLSSFTEKDAAFFFGRDVESAALWAKLRARRLLAVIGPSGAGKTSFVRAGLVASRPDGWGAVVCTPGASALRSLGRALVPELAGDPAVLGALVDIDDAAVAFDLVGRWRRAHGEALLVVDQFEELFTLNPGEIQTRFAALLGRLAGEGDVHVVLSLRDDFLIRCSDQAALAAVFLDLTPLPALSREGLVRALVEPARKQGYRFEDDELVAEMVSAVEGARAALPLLAFAVSRLWGRRDRERKLLTRAAYEEVGGVAGALAQHAEATLEAIGLERQGLVRAIFRQLVTADGTRAVADRQELLTAFSQAEAAEEVLNALVDARLLTSYEVEGPEGQPGHHRVEVAHESLLKTWPRLVRWQAQDAEGAVLRDQLRQAARLWKDKGRTGDLLWTGTAFQEFELWHGRHPGTLTALEEEFARAMREKARRRRRIVRAVGAAVVLAALGVAAAVGVSRQQAVRARDQAQAAALRAEASKVLALAQLRLADDPTEALALATASLELADSQEARIFALKALSEAPPALELLAGNSVMVPAFSADGDQLAGAGLIPEARVWRATGGEPLVLPGHAASALAPLVPRWASPRRLIVSKGGKGTRAWVWSLPDGHLEGTLEFGGDSFFRVVDSQAVSVTPLSGTGPQPELWLRSWPLPDGPPVDLGRVPRGRGKFGPGGRSWLHAKGAKLVSRPLPVSPRTADTVLGLHPPGIEGLKAPPGRDDQVVTINRAGERRLWTLEDGQPPRSEALSWPEGAEAGVEFDQSGRWLVSGSATDARVKVWGRGDWTAARPLELRRRADWYLANWATDAEGKWLVATTGMLSRLTFWPLRRPRPLVVNGYDLSIRPVTFSPDGRWLATAWPKPPNGALVQIWSLATGPPRRPRVMDVPGWHMGAYELAFDPAGRFLLRVGNGGEAWVVPLDGQPPRRLQGYSKEALMQAAAVSPSGRQVATAYMCGSRDKFLRVWDLVTGEARSLDLPEPAPPPGTPPPPGNNFEAGVFSMVFGGEDAIYTGGHGGLRRWDLATGRQETILEAPHDCWLAMRIRPEKSLAVTRQYGNPQIETCAPVTVHDLANHSSRDLLAFGSCVLWFELDAAGQVLVTGDKDGTVRVGRLAESEPHLLLGHKGVIDRVALSPDLKWVASTGGDNTLRLWPMPDLSKPPLHTLSHADLVAKLKSLTNLRAVRDAKAPSGWTIELDRFPGWKHVPTW